MQENAVKKQLETDRKFLHQYPEEGWTEFVTTYYVAQRLKSLGIPFVAGKKNIDERFVLGRNEQKVEKALARALEWGVPEEFLSSLEGYPSVVAEIDTGKTGPLTACRFDMDCVLVEESQSMDHAPTRDGYCSVYPGLMHACGHDAHTAVGLSVAQWVQRNKEKLTGKIRLIFQPAEEGTRGAYPMTHAGVVDGVDYLIGGHIGGPLPLGSIMVMAGGFMATSKIDVRFTGKASHAGAEPEQGRSALMAAASAALMYAGITRHSQGDSRISVGTLYAGEGRNVTPVHAKMQLETRGQTKEVNQFLEDRVRSITEGVAAAYDVECKVQLAGKAETIPVCRELIEKFVHWVQEIPSIDSVCEMDRPFGSEDCSLFMQRVVEQGGQAVFFVYGSDQRGHHKSDFDVRIEALMNGYAVFTHFIENVNQ